MSRVDRRKLEAALERERQKEYKQRNQIGFFQRFIERWHRPLLQEIADRYKARGIYPAWPEYLLPAFYQDEADKEIAVLAGMFVDDVTEMRDVMGEHPAEWFRRRGFVALSVGDEQNRHTGGALNWRIAAFFNELHDLTLQGRVSIERSLAGEAARMAVTLESAVIETAYAAGVDLDPIRVRSALVVLSPADGLGTSLWHSCPFEVRNPLTSDVKRFLGYWWPGKPRAVSADEAIELFGLRSDLDFLYASLGWEEMVEADRKKCRDYVKFYQLWFGKGWMSRPYRWREVLPEVKF